MHERTKQLRELRDKYDLTGLMISKILGVSHNTAMTWLMPETRRVIPEGELKILKRQLTKRRIILPECEIDIHDNTLELRKLRDKHKLTAARIAELTERSKTTALIWLTLRSPRPIPDGRLKLLKEKLSENEHGNVN
ncbi:putative DNA-binding protein [Acinetobacter phage vB_AbaP_Alexa]|nr:putative DNA-binding protein [Acinetobacter phage vB_AbaP_Alexa]